MTQNTKNEALVQALSNTVLTQYWDQTDKDTYRHMLEDDRTVGLLELLDRQEEIAAIFRDCPAGTRTYRETTLLVQHAFYQADPELVDAEQTRIVDWLLSVNVPGKVKTWSITQEPETANTWRKLYLKAGRAADQLVAIRDHKPLLKLMKAGPPQIADSDAPTPEEIDSLSGYYRTVSAMYRFLEHTSELSDLEWEENKPWLAETKQLIDSGLIPKVSINDPRWAKL